MRNQFLLIILLVMGSIQNPMAQEKGTLIVLSTPEGSEVLLNGEKTGLKTPFEKDVEVGTYAVEIRFSQFQWYRDTVLVTANNTTSLNENKREATGTFIITSVPSEADVYYENEHMGYTPFQMGQVTPGNYKFRLEKDKFNKRNLEIDVTEGQVAEKYVELTAGYGTISIMTKPNGNIYIDKELKANHIFNGRLDAGTHVIEVKKEDHKSETRIVLIKKGEEYRELFLLKPIFGSLSILSNPPGATIYLNDEEIGLTPKILNDMSIGDHKLRLEKDGHAPFRSKVTIEEDRTFYVEGTLVKGIQLTTSPSDAMIYLDGKPIGKSPQVLMKLTHGKHTLKIEKEGYAMINKEINVDLNNLQTTMHENLIDGVLLTSEPSGASVYVDGELVGNTPKLFDALGDTTQIVLKKDGFAWEEWTQIVVDDESMVIHKDLKEGCTVSISTVSEDGEIWVDEKFLGKQQVRLTLFKGKHNLKVLNSKYFNDVENEILVESNGQAFDMEQKRKSCSVVVTSVPDKGMSYLNERSFLETNGSNMLDADVYELKLERNKYLTIYDTIDVFEPNMSFNYTMIPEKFRDKGTAIFLSMIFPGSGNAYLTRGKKSSIAGFLFYGLVAGSYYTHLESEDLLDQMRFDPTPDRQMQDDQEMLALASDVMKYTAAGVWVINMIRVLAAPSEKKQYQKMGLISSYNPEINTHSVGLAYTF